MKGAAQVEKVAASVWVPLWEPNPNRASKELWLTRKTYPSQVGSETLRHIFAKQV